MFKHYEHLLRVTAGRADARDLHLRIYREIGLLAVADALGVSPPQEERRNVEAALTSDPRTPTPIAA